MSGLLREAIKLAELGKSVFPLLPRDKHPYADLLPKDENGKATWKPFQTERASIAQIEEWWTHAPNANIAIATGAVSGEFVLDVDGADGIAELNKRGKMPKTQTAKTHNGYHTHWQHPGFNVPNRVKFLPGLDTRGDAGYIVAPPSLHPLGGDYHWLISPDDIPLAECPEWLLTLLKPRVIDRPAYVPPTDQTEDELVDLVRRALNALNSSRRDNYEEWVKVGMSLKELGSTGLMLWESWSGLSDKYKPGECARKWDNFRGDRTVGSLFYDANTDSGQSWRPFRPVSVKEVSDIDRYVPRIQKTEWAGGVPIAVRAILNEYAPPCTAPVLELVVEGLNAKLIKATDQITVECLSHVSKTLGRGMPEGNIRRGLKGAADPHGGQFLSKSVHYLILADREDIDPCAEFERNPCGCPGRTPDYYQLLPRDVIFANVARSVIAPLIQKAFPIDSELIAPIRSEFLADLGRDDADSLADDLKTRYGELLESQPGYADAMATARREYKRTIKRLEDEETAPIPDGWTYKNQGEYLSACARALVEAKGGETQMSRAELCRKLGCKERMIPSIFKNGGMDILKDQTIDVEIQSIAEIKQLEDYDKKVRGAPLALVSDKKQAVFSLKKSGAIAWAEGEFAAGAKVSIRYHQANRQRIVTKEAPEVEAPKVIKPRLTYAAIVYMHGVVENWLSYLTWFTEPESVSDRYFRQQWIALLLEWAVDRRPAIEPDKKVVIETYEERWLRMLVSKTTGAKVETHHPDRAVKGAMKQAAFHYLLGEVDDSGGVPDEQPITNRKLLTGDPLIDWLVTDCGGTVTAVYDTVPTVPIVATVEREAA